MPQNINFRYISSLAYQEILNQQFDSFPIPVFSFQHPNIKFFSFQEYSKRCHIPLADLTDHGKLNDGYVIKNLRPHLHIILYNQNSHKHRMTFTIMHEIAHCLLPHKHHGGKEEIEANFFASQVLAPNTVLKEILRRNYSIDLELLMTFFQISRQAAIKKMQYFSRFPDGHPNEKDQKILHQFAKAIDYFFPNKMDTYPINTLANILFKK